MMEWIGIPEAGREVEEHRKFRAMPIPRSYGRLRVQAVRAFRVSGVKSGSRRGAFSVELD